MPGSYMKEFKLKLEEMQLNSEDRWRENGESVAVERDAKIALILSGGASLCCILSEAPRCTVRRFLAPRLSALTLVGSGSFPLQR